MCSFGGEASPIARDKIAAMVAAIGSVQTAEMQYIQDGDWKETKRKTSNDCEMKGQAALGVVIVK
jgi:predicted DNA-binding protein with PD1-like motif